MAFYWHFEIQIWGLEAISQYWGLSFEVIVFRLQGLGPRSSSRRWIFQDDVSTSTAHLNKVRPFKKKKINKNN